MTVIKCDKCDFFFWKGGESTYLIIHILVISTWEGLVSMLEVFKFKCQRSLHTSTGCFYPVILLPSWAQGRGGQTEPKPAVMGWRQGHTNTNSPCSLSISHACVWTVGRSWWEPSRPSKNIVFSEGSIIPTTPSWSLQRWPRRLPPKSWRAWCGGCGRPSPPSLLP